MYAPMLMTLDATDGSPTVFSPGPLLPAEMNICTSYCEISRSYSTALVLLASLSAGRPPIDMLITSTLAVLAA